mgnify:CR=1 FL=1
MKFCNPNASIERFCLIVYSLPPPIPRFCTENTSDSVGDAEAFCRSNVLKYASRYDRKGTARKDILKIVHYGLLLLHFNDKREKANQTNAGTPSAFTVDYDK